MISQPRGQLQTKPFHQEALVSPPHRMEVEGRRKYIDQKIDKLQSSILALRHERNSLSPISQLPPEILGRAFFFAASDGRANGRPLDWICVSHVSRHWRNVAIHCPSLWTHLPLNNVHWTAEMLQRSKMATLSITNDFRFHSSSSSVQLVLPHMPRIEHLDLSCANPSRDDFQRVIDGLPASAPKLQTLRLAMTTGYYIGSGNSSCFTLPVNALSDTPCLERVTLRSYKADLNSQLFSNLKYLELANVSPAHTTSLDTLMDALSRMPGLETLKLDHCLPSPTSSRSGVKVNLPRLQTLSMSGDVPEVSNILDQVTFPPLVQFKLNCTATPTTSLSSILSSLSGSNSSSDNVQSGLIRTIIMNGSDAFRLLAWTEIFSEDDVFSGGSSNDASLNLEFQWVGYNATLTIQAIRSHIFSALSLKSLIMLRVSYMDISPKQWKETFGMLPQLRLIRTNGDNVSSSLIAALMENPAPTTKPDAIPSVPFPSLRTLIMEGSDFGDEGSFSVDMLRDCLIHRYECGAEIWQLRLFGCIRLEQDDIDELRDIIVDLIWDGIVEGFSDEDEDECGCGEHDYDYDYDYEFEYGGYDDDSDDDILLHHFF